jgi:hypothetical protein
MRMSNSVTCPECLRKKKGMDWVSFPVRIKHLVWIDNKGVWHIHREKFDRTYCKKEIE